MHRWTLILLIVTVPFAAASDEATFNNDFQLFQKLFAGDFNNALQVEAEATAGEEATHPWHHYTVRRVNAPQLGESVYYAQINAQGPSGAVVRQRLHVLLPDPEAGVIRQRFFAFSDGTPWVDVHLDPSRLKELELDALRSYPDGCEIIWKREIDQFRGEIPHGSCQVRSPRSGTQLTIVATMVLGADEMWHREAGFSESGAPLFDTPDGKPFRLRRTEPLHCVVRILVDEPTDSWAEHDEILLYDEGGVATVANPHDRQLPYSIRLRQRPAGAGEPDGILELSVHRGDGDRPIASSWTTTDSVRIGVDLSEARVNCRRNPVP